MADVILEENRLNVLFVAFDLADPITLLHTAESTAKAAEIIPTNVTCVAGFAAHREV